MFPSHLINTHVNHRLQKLSLPANDLNSCMPISNPSFISIVLEKVVYSRLNVHLNCNHLYNVVQSAYKQFHITVNRSTQSSQRHITNHGHRKAHSIYVVKFI